MVEPTTTGFFATSSEVLASGASLGHASPAGTCLSGPKQRNRHSYREADGDTQKCEDKDHMLPQEVLDLLQAVLGGERHSLQPDSS